MLLYAVGAGLVGKREVVGVGSYDFGGGTGAIP